MTSLPPDHSAPRRAVAALALALAGAAVDAAATGDIDLRAPLLAAPARPAASVATTAAGASFEPSAPDLQRALDQLASEGRAQLRDTARPGDDAHPPRASTSAAPGEAAAQAFTAREGELLSTSLAAYLARQGWDLAWNAPQDFVVQRSYAVDAPPGGLRPMLLRVLAPFGLSAVLHNTPTQRVVDITAAADAARTAP